jgi:copper homeostasis protein
MGDVQTRRAEFERLPMPRVVLEVCVASVDDALTAVAGGTDRLELNCALALGGLTPSAGLFAEVRRRVRVPVIAMVRPRPGGFYYSDADFEVMARDAEALLAAGADGLAFGILTANGEIDRARCGQLRELCRDRAAVFHRAFDVTPDPFAAMETLIDLGFTRVMTSGQEQTAVEGADLIGKLIDRAASRIEVLPAGGINSVTAPQLVARTGCVQVHASARGRSVDPSIRDRSRVRFSTSDEHPEGAYDRTDPDVLTDLRLALT